MSNPLLDKFEEIYGEKKAEVAEEKEKRGMDLLKEVVSSAMYGGLRGGMADDIITMNPHSGITLSPNYTSIAAQPQGQLTFNAATNELCVSNGVDDVVIPTGKVENGKMIINGDYISADKVINKNQTPTCFVFDPPKTEMEKHFLKVLEDVANGRAVVSDIRADVDASFTGFGGQIKYSIGIVGKYP
jgi:hypothetical protein